jgi:diguanylate cyclase (GGDEF)-like protein
MAVKILIADDNRANREALASLLEAAGYDVSTAADGWDALMKAREERPALVIADVLMPKMDGYELARRLREDPALQAAGVIFYTAYFGERDAQDLARAHGVEQVLVKPSDNDVILASVREVLASRARTPEPGSGQLDPNLDQSHLRVMVNQLLQKTEALEAQQRRIERLNRTLSTLSAVNALIARTQDRQSLLDDACRLAVESGGFGFAAIALTEKGHPLGMASYHSEAGVDPAFARVPREPRFIICNDIEAEADFPGREQALRYGFLSYLVLPTGGEDDAGVLILYARQRGFFDDEELRLLHELAGDLSFALRHLSQKARMNYLAYHDSLTGLPNRALFADRLAQAIATARRARRFAAVVLLDVQRFRLVNETIGRNGGDELLRQIGARMRETLPDEHTVARVGGDHFAIVAGAVENLDQAARTVTESLEQAFAGPFLINGTEMRIALRAGVAVFPGDGDDAETLAANAETALNRAKETGQRHLFYAPQMNNRVAEILALENRLRLALDDGRLSLHYQPKIDMRTSELAGLEALIRWDDPELGVVPPSQFVALMEETGMILAAGRWALGRAVEDIRRWQSLGLEVPRTAVNVSALQLRQGDFVDSVLQAIAGFGAHPILDLEITESVLLDDIDDSTKKLQILRRAGVEVSWTTSAPAIPRSTTWRACRWTRSRSTAASSCACATRAIPATSSP